MKKGLILFGLMVTVFLVYSMGVDAGTDYSIYNNPIDCTAPGFVLCDDFEDASINTDLWDNQGGHYSESEGNLVMTPLPGGAVDNSIATQYKIINGSESAKNWTIEIKLNCDGGGIYGELSVDQEFGSDYINFPGINNGFEHFYIRTQDYVGYTSPSNNWTILTTKYVTNSIKTEFYENGVSKSNQSTSDSVLENDLYWSNFLYSDGTATQCNISYFMVWEGNVEDMPLTPPPPPSLNNVSISPTPTAYNWESFTCQANFTSIEELYFNWEVYDVYADKHYNYSDNVSGLTGETSYTLEKNIRLPSSGNYTDGWNGGNWSVEFKEAILENNDLYINATDVVTLTNNATGGVAEVRFHHRVNGSLYDFFTVDLGNTRAMDVFNNSIYIVDDHNFSRFGFDGTLIDRFPHGGHTNNWGLTNNESHFFMTKLNNELKMYYTNLSKVANNPIITYDAFGGLNGCRGITTNNTYIWSLCDTGLVLVVNDMDGNSIVNYTSDNFNMPPTGYKSIAYYDGTLYAYQSQLEVDLVNYSFLYNVSIDTEFLYLDNQTNLSGLLEKTNVSCRYVYW
jgi:hypothetical protein